MLHYWDYYAITVELASQFFIPSDIVRLEKDYLYDCLSLVGLIMQGTGVVRNRSRDKFVAGVMSVPV